MSTNPDAGWHPDPAGTHEQRYWDGAAWTMQISDGGVRGVDTEITPAGQVPTTFAAHMMTVTLYERELVISRTGLAAKLADAQVWVPLGALRSVGFRAATALRKGHLQLVVTDALNPPPPKADDPYTVMFGRAQQEGLAELRDLLIEEAARNKDSGVSVDFEPVQSKTQTKRHALEARNQERQAALVARSVERRAELQRLKELKKSGDYFAGVTLADGRVESKHGGGPVEGAKATVDTAGALLQRFTVTRLALFGGLGLGLQKKQDRRELYLVVEGKGWGIVVPVHPRQGLKARTFAARINAAGSTQAAAPASDAHAKPDAAERLRALAALRDEGILTSEEFETKKRELISEL